MNPVTDMHAHFMPAATIRAAESGDLWYGMAFERPPEPPRDPSVYPIRPTQTFRRVPKYYETPGERLGGLEAAGVDRQVVSLTPVLYKYDLPLDQAIPFVREVNDELRNWAQEWPQHYLGFATLPLQDTDASVAELERAVRDLGLVGAIVDTNVLGEDWDSPQLLPVLQAAEALGAIVFVHPGLPRVAKMLPNYHLRNVIGNPLETTIAVASMIYGGALDQVPDLKVLLAHGGGFCCADVGRFDHSYSVRPEAQGAELLPSAYLRRLYYDSLTHSEQALRYILDVAGGSQVMLGTDYPADMGPSKPFDWVSSCDSLSAEEKHAVLRDNAAALLGARVSV